MSETITIDKEEYVELKFAKLQNQFMHVRGEEYFKHQFDFYILEMLDSSPLAPDIKKFLEQPENEERLNKIETNLKDEIISRIECESAIAMTLAIQGPGLSEDDH